MHGCAPGHVTISDDQLYADRRKAGQEAYVKHADQAQPLAEHESRRLP